MQRNALRNAEIYSDKFQAASMNTPRKTSGEPWIKKIDEEARVKIKSGCTVRSNRLNSLVGREWLEHSTYGLRVRCSTN